MQSANTKIKIVGAALVVLTMVLGASCGGGSSSKKGKGQPKEIRIEPSVVILRAATDAVDVRVLLISTTGRKTDITLDPGTAIVSSDLAVATVTAGTVTPQGAGTATLDVSYQTFTATAQVYSDFAPALAAGDFDLVAAPGAVRQGRKVTLPVVLETGSSNLGSYRLRFTYDAAHFELVSVQGGADLNKPLAIEDDTPGEAVWTDTYSPSLGQTLAGTLEVARVVLRATGAPGDASIITGEAIGVWTTDFPAAPVGVPTPRPFVTGRRWMVVE